MTYKEEWVPHEATLTLFKDAFIKHANTTVSEPFDPPLETLDLGRLTAAMIGYGDALVDATLAKHHDSTYPATVTVLSTAVQLWQNADPTGVALAFAVLCQHLAANNVHLTGDIVED